MHKRAVRTSRAFYGWKLSSEDSQDNKQFHTKSVQHSVLSSETPKIWICWLIKSTFLDGSNSMETDNEANTVPERPHITHEYLVTTLATLCTSQENVEYIVPCLVENLTTLSESMLFYIG